MMITYPIFPLFNYFWVTNTLVFEIISFYIDLLLVNLLLSVYVTLSVLKWNSLVLKITDQKLTPY